MMKPKRVREAEAAQSPEVREAGEKAHKALFDDTMSDEEADAIITAYNAMPNAVKKLTRTEYRANYRC